MTDEQKAPFRKEAENLRYLHQLEYPDYKYRPKKRQRSGTEAAQQVPSSALASLIPGQADLSGFWRYEGGLTTPTCNEIVEVRSDRGIDIF